MDNVLALIPARAHSKGIPSKNFRELAGISPVERAYRAAFGAGIERIVVSSDSHYAVANWNSTGLRARLLMRPLELAQDDTPMIDVVQHALTEIPGPEDQIILLLQPTQPLRQPKHLTAAIEALTSDWDSVVTVTPIPRTHAPEFTLWYDNTTLSVSPSNGRGWRERPIRRQAVNSPYVADGTAYVFRRRTFAEHGNIYGEYVRGLIIDPSETTPLDTPTDWARAEELLRAR